MILHHTNQELNISYKECKRKTKIIIISNILLTSPLNFASCQNMHEVSGAEFVILPPLPESLLAPAFPAALAVTSRKELENLYPEVFAFLRRPRDKSGS